MAPKRNELIAQARATLQEMMWHSRIRFRTLAKQHGLTAPQASMLLFVDRSGRAVTMSESADALEFPPSSITSIVNRLVALGLIERGVRNDDRRVVTAFLTRSGTELVRKITAKREESFARLLDDVDDSDVAHFCEVLATIRRTMAP